MIDPTGHEAATTDGGGGGGSADTTGLSNLKSLAQVVPGATVSYNADTGVATVTIGNRSKDYNLKDPQTVVDPKQFFSDFGLSVTQKSDDSSALKWAADHPGTIVLVGAGLYMVWGPEPKDRYPGRSAYSGAVRLGVWRVIGSGLTLVGVASASIDSAIDEGASKIWNWLEGLVSH